MADRNIVTQVGIEDLKYVLGEIAENLYSHVNESLSKAHGINLVTGYVDGEGNDLTSYQDSNGDSLGEYILRIVVGDTVYFAPGKLTTLGGQSLTTGSVDTSAEGEADSQGGSAWVTDFTSDQVLQAQAINNDVLLTHTRVAADEAHGGLTAIVQDSYSALGHRIGTHAIKIRINNVIYSIPCSSRFGGPLQPPRIGGIPSNISVEIGDDEPNDCDVPITVPFIGGTKPVAYHWQFNNSGTWTDIEPSAVAFLSIPGWDNGIRYQWSSTANPTFRITEVKPGSDETRSASFRCRVTNPAVPDSGPSSGTITNTMILTASDETDCFITTAVCVSTGLGDNCEALTVLRQFRENYMVKSRFGPALLEEYGVLGPKIVRKLRKSPAMKKECAEIYNQFIAPAVRSIKAGKNHDAFATYCTMVRELQARYMISRTR